MNSKTGLYRKSYKLLCIIIALLLITIGCAQGNGDSAKILSIASLNPPGSANSSQNGSPTTTDQPVVARPFTRIFGGGGWDSGLSVTLDQSGNTYVSGTMSGIQGFLAKHDRKGAQISIVNNDAVWITSDSHGYIYSLCYNNGDTFWYLKKYSAAGSVQWSIKVANIKGAALTVNSAGTVIYVGGYSYDSHTGIASSFVLKYDGSGNQQWMQPLSGNSIIAAIALDSQENVYPTGYSVSGGIGYDAFLAKLDSAGTLKWSQLLGSAGQDYGYGVVVDSEDKILMTGRAGGSLGGQSFGGSYDAFIAKYSSNGTTDWIRLIGGPDMDDGYGIATDSSNNVVLVGGEGGHYALFSKFTGTGTNLWTKRIASNDGMCGSSIVINAKSEFFITGWINTPLDGQNPQGSYDAFLIKTDKDGNRL
ncbi:MAG: SBBP repeat-containing protein [Leptospira sp.]|nr:SBBP repeat-containing protein [Leptospira sp.]